MKKKIRHLLHIHDYEYKKHHLQILHHYHHHDGTANLIEIIK